MSKRDLIEAGEIGERSVDRGGDGGQEVSDALAAIRRYARSDTEAAAPGEATPREAASTGGYLRKNDWLRAQFLPEVEVLDFRGLFVGNKGL